MNKRYLTVACSADLADRLRAGAGAWATPLIACATDAPIAADVDAQDRLLRYGTCDYTYNANGDLEPRLDTATNAATAYRYDEFGNLRKVELPNDDVIDYVIDGLNRRVGKKRNGTVEQSWLYSGALEPVAEFDGNGNLVARYVYGEKAHVPTLMIKAGVTYKILSDHLGSVRQVIDAETGEVLQSLDYDAWGNVLLDTNPGFQPFGYAGGLCDRDTGLVRFGARDYDPVIGRWTTKDAIRFKSGTVNLFAYAESNPVTRFDPSGLASCTYSIVDGSMVCVSAVNGTTMTINVASGNNGGGMACKNNPFCTHLPNQGPIPMGTWEWTNGWTGKPNGRVLQPNSTAVVFGRDQFRTHSCANAFGPSASPPFCSEGCITGSASDMQSLNALIDAEPGSTLEVTSGFDSVSEMWQYYRSH